jgi:hypothetical protein
MDSTQDSNIKGKPGKVTKWKKKGKSLTEK